MRLVGEHPRFGAAGPLAFLAADFFHLGALRGDEAILLFLDFIEQQAPRDETVHPLLARLLTFHLHAGRPMQEHHAGGNLVDVLPAVAARTDEGFLNVGLAHLQRGHAQSQLIGFFEADRKRTHAGNVARIPAHRHKRNGNFLLTPSAMA